LVFLGCFWAYAGQLHNHIGWAMSMRFTSTNSTNPRTNLWNFHKKILRIGDFKKLSFFWVGHFGFFFQKKLILFHPHENQSKVLGYQGWDKNLMITLISSQKPSTRNLCPQCKWLVVYRKIAYIQSKNRHILDTEGPCLMQLLVLGKSRISQILHLLNICPIQFFGKIL
jgi:hypothetical protein